MTPADQVAADLAHEVVAGGAGGGVAVVCAECFAMAGVAPEYAAALAIGLGVVARLVVDAARWARARRAAKLEDTDAGG